MDKSRGEGVEKIKKTQGRRPSKGLMSGGAIHMAKEQPSHVQEAYEM